MITNPKVTWKPLDWPEQTCGPTFGIYREDICMASVHACTRHKEVFLLLAGDDQPVRVDAFVDAITAVLTKLARSVPAVNTRSRH